MSTVLLTGASTPSGSALALALVKQAEHRALCVIAPGERCPPVLAEHPAITVAHADLARERSVRELLFGPARDLDVDTIIHAALHRRANDRGGRVHRLNVEGTRELLRLAEAQPSIQRFIFRSFGDVYRLRANLPTIVDEEHPLELSPGAPQWVRDRVEADLTACTRMGLSRLRIVVLRFAELLAKDSGSQLYDYLGSRVCLRTLGFDPMINVLSQGDLNRAIEAALRRDVVGIFNIPGADTLPISEVVRRAGCLNVPLPGATLAPLYQLRRLTVGGDFRYDMNAWRFHFGGVLDGRRARDQLGYAPEVPIGWSALAARHDR